MRKTHKKACQCILWVISWVSQVARHSRNTPNTWVIWISTCAPHVTFWGLHESLVNCKMLCSLQFFTNFHIEPITFNPTKIQGKDWRITIKFNTKLKSTKQNWIFFFLILYIIFAFAFASNMKYHNSNAMSTSSKKFHNKSCVVNYYWF